MNAHDERPSLLQVSVEPVHREQEHEHASRIHTKPIRRNHQHQGHWHQRRQAAGNTNQGGSGVSEEVVTVSVIQQYTVDLAGNTIGQAIWTSHADEATAPGIGPEVTPTPTPVPGTVAEPSAPSIIDAGQLILSTNIQNIQTDNTFPNISISISIPITIPAAVPTSVGFPPLNNTIPALNSTLSSASRSSNRSTTSLTQLRSSSTSKSSSSKSLSTTTIASTSSLIPTSTTSLPLSTTTEAAGFVPIVGSAGTDDGRGGGSTSGDDSDGGGSPPASTATIAGSVVGSLAGLAVLIAIIVFAIRWKRNRGAIRLTGDNRPRALGDSHSGKPGPLPSTPPGPPSRMSQTVSMFVIPQALANITGYRHNKRASAAPSHTNSSVAESERGFYRVSGRKLPSQFANRDDDIHYMSQDSLFASSPGIDGAVGFAPGSPERSPPQMRGAMRDSGPAVLRPGPSRTVTASTMHSTHSAGQHSLSNYPGSGALRRPDMLGRSHPSQDGSKGSRFLEDV